MKTCIFLFNLFFSLINVPNNLLLQGCENGMTLIADNPFISQKELSPFKKGIRIDYILFKVGESFVSSHVLNLYSLMFTARCWSHHISLFFFSFLFFFFFKLPGFFQSRHLLWFHVNHQRLRPWPSIPVLRPWSADSWTQARDRHSNWGWKWQESD